MSDAPNTTTRFFYQGDKLVTVEQGAKQRAIFRTAEQPLAELSTYDTQTGGLLATDQMGSVLVVHGSDKQP
ncbi:hypothetical protein MXM82_05605 [Pseudomonas asiatica]|uniref:hypothetical protein n=1 Tax=Pseudomonas asiatica TaxID=2219225 RepID=UPI002DB85293|nr:hypothetical protein [Pseudomonas asiatica]MEB6588614.1 hypothetical protein [Pseudomonas asiatica]